MDDKKVIDYSKYLSYTLEELLKECSVVLYAAHRGKGGQNVNKVASAVRITHLPTGIRSDSIQHREQLKNKNTALKNLLLKLKHQAAKQSDEKKTLRRTERLKVNTNRINKVKKYKTKQSIKKIKTLRRYKEDQ